MDLIKQMRKARLANAATERCSHSNNVEIAGDADDGSRFQCRRCSTILTIPSR